MHEISRQIVSEVIVADPSVQDPFGFGALIGPVLTPSGTSDASRINSAPVDPALLPKLSGAALVQQFALVPASDVSAFATANASSIKHLLRSPVRASVVASAFSSLSVQQQKAWIKNSPQVVGNLEGVPFTVRDSANRLELSRTVASLKASLASGAGRSERVDNQHHLDILEQVVRTLTVKKGEPSRQLLTFDPSGEVRAAVVVGNLETADYVSYLVPGMFFTVQGQMYDWTVIANDLHSEQESWINRLSATDPAMKGKTVATVAWIGYRTPGVLDLGSLSRANQGAKYLGQAIDGIKAVRAGNEPYVSLITHSYGSTAAMIELAKGGVSVDALAIVGSPGGATQSASALDVKNDNVYVGEAAWDPVVNTAFYGSDPGMASFGAHKMNVAGGTDAITHKQLGAAIGHLGYFDPGTEAMRNFALISLGQGALVTDGTLADASRTIASK